jgi:hypothetical protein
MDLINCRVEWAEVFAGIAYRGNRHSRKNKCSCGRSGIVMLKKNENGGGSSEQEIGAL